MTKEERMEKNLKEIDAAIDGIEARLRQMNDILFGNDEERMVFQLAFQGIILMRICMEDIKRYTLKRA